MRNIILFFLIFFCNLSNSQLKKGTIFFNDNTSIEGYGMVKKNKIYFSVTKNDEPSEWSYDIAKGITFAGKDEVIEYSYNEKYEFVKIDTDSKTLLLQVLDEGSVHLYRRKKSMPKVVHINGIFVPSSNPMFPGSYTGTTEFKENFVYYVKKQNEEYARNISFSFKSRARAYFSDCEAIIDKIKKKYFIEDNIPEMVAYYNDYCVD
jgi:hypothetical protein